MSICKKKTRKTENPCVPGSIPGEATIIKNQQNADFFCYSFNKKSTICKINT